MARGRFLTVVTRHAQTTQSKPTDIKHAAKLVYTEANVGGIYIHIYIIFLYIFYFYYIYTYIIYINIIYIYRIYIYFIHTNLYL